MAKWKTIAFSGAGLAAAASAVWYLNRGRDVDVISGSGDGGTGGGGGGGGGGGDGGGGGGGGGGMSSGGVVDNVGSEGNAPMVGDARWGNVPTPVQTLLTKVQSAADIPYLWVIGSIIAQGEASFQPNAHNTEKKEVDASAAGLKNGIARGNPKPKFADEIAAFGSGGYFGALAPYFAWIGLDEGYMPFLNRRPSLMFAGEAAAVFMAHYFWRVTMPSYAKGRKLNLFDVRVGWASPSVLKNDPFGKTAQGVRGRMRESISVIGWDEKWVEGLPIMRDRYRGIQAVAPALGYSPAQSD